MSKREELLKDPAYWFEGEQNELFRQVDSFMSKERINRTELANRLGVSKGYVSQILSGDSNFTLRKHIEICLAIGIVPEFRYSSLDHILKQDSEKKEFFNNPSVVCPIHIRNGFTKGSEDEVDVKVTVSRDYAGLKEYHDLLKETA